MHTYKKSLYKKIQLLFSVLLFASASSFAQSDACAGQWQMVSERDSVGKAFRLQLHVAKAERGLLYPAELRIRYNSFEGVYQLLLVKKNSRETGISRNKFAVSEQPFSIGNATSLINGILDFNRDKWGQPHLSLIRLDTRVFSAVKDTTLTSQQQQEKTDLINFLYKGEISFSKATAIPWKDESSHILNPSVSPAYFGLLDTIYLSTRDGNISLAGFKNTDIVSVMLNGKPLTEQVSINKKKAQADEILLDTGLNTLVLFAENFGNDLPSQAMMNLQFGSKKFKLDFNNRRDSGASFIIAQLFVEKDKDKEIYFRENSGAPNPPLQNNETLLGSITSVSRQLTFAIWDDAVEDGDSISISINGEWITRGFPVKKVPQFITINLKSGANAISFKADNIGSIPPNTSVLEIIDGKRRKSYMLETVPGENKVLDIFYEIKPY